MPTLISAGPGNVTGITMENNAFWRLQLGVTMMEQTPALSLILRYPPGGADNQISLLRVAVAIAQDHGEVQRIADVALMRGDKEGDRDRLREAYELFKNNPRTPSQASLEEALTQGLEMIDAYWRVREWLLDPNERARLTLQLGNQTLVGEP